MNDRSGETIPLLEPIEGQPAAPDSDDAELEATATGDDELALNADEFVADDGDALEADEELPDPEDASPDAPTYREYVFFAPPGKTKERIDLFLTRHLPHATRTRVQKLIDGHFVTINNEVVKKAGRLVVPDDKIVAVIPREPAPEIIPQDIPLDIVYEDDAILIVNKRAGMVVHPAHGNYRNTLVNALLHHANQLSHVRESSSPGILHRIDKLTSGLLVVAKTNAAHVFLANHFKKHTIEREYWAIAWGSFPDRAGVIELPLGRHPVDRKRITVVRNGKYAHTSYQVLADYGFMSLIKLRLKTGRTHQIRVHLSHLHHPILGDPVYFGRRIMYGNISADFKGFVHNLLGILHRQALHAKTLGFIHPSTLEWVSFDSPIPTDMQAVLLKLKRYCNTYRLHNIEESEFFSEDIAHLESIKATSPDGEPQSADPIPVGMLSSS